jgi:hypothetical protein
MVKWKDHENASHSMFVNDEYSGLAYLNTQHKTWWFTSHPLHKDLHTTDLEEAKAIALTLWSFNK